MPVWVLTYGVKVTVVPTLDLAGEQFVSLTTFRRDGTPVPTPVWIAQDGDAPLVVTTPAGTGKVKRLRHDPRVELRTCNRRRHGPGRGRARVGCGRSACPATAAP